jgi:hypothetical protein
MKNFTKSFRLGEHAHYDNIRTTVSADGTLLIQCSNSGPEILKEQTFNKFEFMQGKPHDFLFNITTSYYSDKIMETVDKFYLKLKIKFNDL